MSATQKLFALISVLALIATSSLAQDATKQNKKQTVAPAAASNPVVGSGSAGQITKWVGVDGLNTFSVGDSNITEDKFGKVGVGTRTPTSPFTVRGTIETSLGGFKFPDGTVQTTSAAASLSTVAHDATLQGAGTTASPLGVASPLMVRDLDNPARQPVQVQTSCSGISACTAIAYTVPTGKRLVIEYVSMEGDTDVGKVVGLVVSINPGRINSVAFTFPLSSPAVTFAGGLRRANIGQAVRLYADAETDVSLMGFSNRSDGVNDTFLFQFSGYLVDIP